jgi:hypothetical protein
VERTTTVTGTFIDVVRDGKIVEHWCTDLGLR